MSILAYQVLISSKRRATTASTTRSQQNDDWDSALRISVAYITGGHSYKVNMQCRHTSTIDYGPYTVYVGMYAFVLDLLLTTIPYRHLERKISSKNLLESRFRIVTPKSLTIPWSLITTY